MYKENNFLLLNVTTKNKNRALTCRPHNIDLYIFHDKIV